MTYFLAGVQEKNNMFDFQVSFIIIVAVMHRPCLLQRRNESEVIHGYFMHFKHSGGYLITTSYSSGCCLKTLV
jgi:hypothetical protein